VFCDTKRAEAVFIHVKPDLMLRISFLGSKVNLGGVVSGIEN
jgi:hypothetical protein